MNDENKKRAENPNVSEEPDTGHGDHVQPQTHLKLTTPTKRRKRKVHAKFEQPNFQTIPGVYKLTLSELTQKIIGCVAGENVTVEKPWMYVDKVLIMDNLELHSESSEFLPVSANILKYPRPQVLIGYVPDESTDYDEFYICLTEVATDAVKALVDKLQKRQEERLRNSVYKTTYEWTDLGSEKEIDESLFKTNRPLIEVEVESVYPILPFKIQLRHAFSQDSRDGYVELVAGDDLQPSISRRRVDAEIQVTPSVTNNEAQTICSYPSNVYTQYEYKIDLGRQKQATEECKKIIEQYMHDHGDTFLDSLLVNGHINFYTDDYQCLKINPAYTMKIILPPPVKYLTFINMELCQGKLIGFNTWHPFFSGIAAASYVDRVPAVYITSPPTEDIVHRTIHGTNPVLLWCFQDDLHPRLILESPREVFSLSFCPYNKNLLLGGLSNGQIVLWDITNKLEQVEQEEILNLAQQKYRSYMFQLMNWMRNIHNTAKVRPTALSDLKYSHRACVTSITWMTPTHKMLKTGKFEKCQEGQSSLQFMSSGRDGAVLIWDLLAKPHIGAGGYRPSRKSRRLKKRPSALVATSSPFKILHLNLRPIYRINVNHPAVPRPLSITCCLAKFCNIKYDPIKKKIPTDLSERIAFEISSLETFDPITPDFLVGTDEGDFLYAKWEGQAFDSGEIVNFENAQILNCAKYHDGPIVSISYSRVLKMFMTVGGRVLALWHNDFKNRPLIWRKGECVYTYGKFFYHNRVALKMLRSDGYFERWLFSSRSNGPINYLLMSDGPNTSVTTHVRQANRQIVGLADNRGSFRIFTVHPQTAASEAHTQKRMKEYVQAELKRRSDFVAWQDKWNEHFAGKAESKTTNKTKLSVEPIPVSRSKITKSSFDKVEKKSSKSEVGKKYIESAKNEHLAREVDRIRDIVSDRKQLDVERLKKEREPLRKLEAENEIKRKKQRNRLRDSEKIYKETVTMLFPDVVKIQPPPPPDPYSVQCDLNYMECCFQNYKNVANMSQDFVESHPFKYYFNWGDVLNDADTRRKNLDETYAASEHYGRYPNYKLERDNTKAAEDSLTNKIKTGPVHESEEPEEYFDSLEIEDELQAADEDTI